MKAIQYTSFGKSDVIAVADVPKPKITNEDEVLIRVKAATVNPIDIKIRNGAMQEMMPVKLPLVPGADVGGVVEAIGTNVTHVKVGDEVIASMQRGAYAEYAVAQKDMVSAMPEGLTYGEGAALVVTLGTAQSVLLTEGNLQKGQRCFIQGAAGAVGGIMVQMAKAAGAYVIGTATGKGLELIKSLGADEAIDYKADDGLLAVKDIDLVADCAGGEGQTKLFGILKRGGKLLSIVMPPPAALAEQYGVEAEFVSSDISGKKLIHGLKLLQEGKLKPVVSKTYKLEDAAQAQDYLAAGGVNGKVVLEVG